MQENTQLQTMVTTFLIISLLVTQCLSAWGLKQKDDEIRGLEKQLQNQKLAAERLDQELHQKHVANAYLGGEVGAHVATIKANKRQMQELKTTLTKHLKDKQTKLDQLQAQNSDFTARK